MLVAHHKAGIKHKIYTSLLYSTAIRISKQQQQQEVTEMSHVKEPESALNDHNF